MEISRYIRYTIISLLLCGSVWAGMVIVTFEETQASAAAPAGLPQKASIVKDYRFTDGDSLADSSTNGYDLTNPGGGAAPTLTNNQCAFDGGDYLSAGDSWTNGGLASNVSVTIAYRIFHQTSAGRLTAAEESTSVGEFYIRPDAPGTLHLYNHNGALADNTLRLAPPNVTNAWYTAAVVLERTNDLAKLYFNGALVKSVTMTGNGDQGPFGQAGVLHYLGGRSWTASLQGWVGTCDYFIIWSTALASNEVMQVHNLGSL